jgi:uncharacterized membrane protein
MELLAVLAVVLAIITPILAISAFVRVQRLAEHLRAFPLDKVMDRLSALERQLTAIEGKLRSAEPRATPPLEPTAAPTARVTLPPETVATPSSETASPSPGSREETPRPREVAPTHFPSPLAAPRLYASQPKAKSSLDWETIIGGRWLNRIGIVALIGATTFFLKYAFDNNWIGPRGRVAIGILLGAAMLPWSQWLLRRGYSYFSEGIAGLGAAVMYLSLWAGCQYYTLYSRDVGFYSMIVVTAGMAAVALGRNSQRIALLSLVGGFLTPILVSSGKDEQVVLFSYLLTLGLGLLAMELRRNWRSLTPVSFVFSVIYFWGWYEKFYEPPKLERTLVFATLFLLLYALVPILRAVKSSSVGELDFLLGLANSFAYFVALYAMLWPNDRGALTLLALALSAGHLTVALVIPPPKSGESPMMRFLYAGLALTFATLAIPLRLDGKWITLAFSVEGAVLVWTGFRSAMAGLRGAGYLLITVSAVRLLVFPLPARRFLLNERFATYAVLIACLAAVISSAGKQLSSVSSEERGLLGFLAVATNFFALFALSLELWDYFGRQSGLGIDSRLAQHLSLSLLWTAYASALIALGIHRKSLLLRWQALSLFGFVVIKVFIYDSSFLERFYRIVSFFILGLVLLVVSFLYQRKVAGQRSS